MSIVLFHSVCLVRGKGMELNGLILERDCLSKIPSIPLFRSLIGTNEVTRECSFHSLLNFPSKNGRNTEIPILSLF
jgi:hypothetical protein